MFEAAELGQKLSKKAYAERVPRLREGLIDAQYRARDAGISVVMVLAGVEGSGKGETINLLLEWMDARGISVHALGLPSQEEAERPFFFRFWRRLPPKGEIGIFFGSWYSSPIIEHALGECSRPDFEKRLDRIVAFERMLVDEGTLLLKYWLHLSKDQQRKRFKELADDPRTSWRVTDEDWAFHGVYDDFIDVSARALQRTDTGNAPWEVVEASNRRFRNASVAAHMTEALEKRLAQPPPSPSPPEPLPQPREKNVIRALDLSLSLDRETYEEKLERWQTRLGRLARRLGPAGRCAVFVFEGTDAAGKGGCIRRLYRAMDARFYRVIPVGAPSEEERAHPYLWRFWRNLPRRGHVTIFDRSWYGRVLVERIEGLAEPEAWRRAYGEIRDFEEQLVDAGVVLLKFWLAISPDEQLRRFLERQETGYKRYKMTDEDWRNRERWAAYEAAASEMVERTGTDQAPWTLVEAEDKLHARIVVLRTVCERLEAAVDDEPKRRKKKRRD
jgi:polyphosphate:AMP phosphotransferase